jgi:hypothetical protein
MVTVMDVWVNHTIHQHGQYNYCLCGSLSPRHGASSGCGWRRRPPDIEVAANTLNKQSRQPIRGDPKAWGLGGGQPSVLRNVTRDLGIDGIL